MIQVGGLATGLDVNSLVSQLVSAEVTPAKYRIDRQEAAYQADISSLGTLKGALNEFKTALEELDSLEDLRPRTATSSNDGLFTISAGDAAVEGSYDVEVVQLATEHRLMSGIFASSGAQVGTGTLTISRGSDTFSVEIGAEAQTLDDLRDAINSATDNPGVRATIINVDDGADGVDSRLVITAGDVGPDNELTITAADDDGNDTDASGLSALAYSSEGTGYVVTEEQGALPAIIKVFDESVTRSTNTIDDAITGVTIDLVSESTDSGSTATATIALDQSSVTSKVNAFVEAYNSMYEALESLGSYDSETEEAGALLGDPTLRTVLSGVRRELATAVTETTGLYSTLAEIGITTQRDGRLSVESSALESALSANFDDVGQLFAGSDGVATRLSTFIDGFVGTDGTIDSRLDGINSRLSDLGDERAGLDERAITLEDRFRAQFTALDQVVAELTTIGNFLTQNLASLPGSINRTR